MGEIVRVNARELKSFDEKKFVPKAVCPQMSADSCGCQTTILLMLNKSADIVSGDGFYMLPAGRFHKTEKSNNCKPAVADRIWATIATMHVMQIMSYMRLATESFIGQLLKKIINNGVRDFMVRIKPKPSVGESC